MAKDDDQPRVDPDTLKGNEIARSVMGSGVRPEGFRVDFRNGTATLFGTVRSEDDKRRVLDAARGIGGVSSWNDSLTVAGGGTGSSSPAGGVRPAFGGPGGRSYTVKSGDTLSAIAKSQYGDASKYNRIFEANRNILSDPDEIKPGQVLNIPE
jgi:nucleoid-associated protein YgaU